MVCFLFALKDLAEHRCKEEGRACWQALRYWLPHTHTHASSQSEAAQIPRNTTAFPTSPHLWGIFSSEATAPLLSSLSILPSVGNKRLQLGLDPSHFLFTSPSFSLIHHFLFLCLNLHLNICALCVNIKNREGECEK